MHTRFAAVAVLLAVAMGAAACGSSDDGEGGGGTPSPSATYAMKAEDAPIDELDLLIRESFPPLYSVKIVSGLPSGCHVFEKAVIAGRGDNEITIRVTNLAPDSPDVMCTAIYGQHESFVDIGSDFESGTDYVVRVNDKTLPFTAQ